MKNRRFFKKVAAIAAVATFAALIPAQAARIAEASATLAEIAVMAVQSKTMLAVAANSGDLEAIRDAQLRSDAIDAAMSEALEAFSIYENAQDEDTATNARQAMEAARQKAQDALTGAVPEPSKEAKHNAWKESQKNTGGGPGNAYDPPNIYDVPWHSAGLRSVYSSMFSSVNSSSGGSSANSNDIGDDFGDRDATPE